MRYAVLADIHSNLEALEATLERLSSERIDDCFLLGDLIGYGANPNECLRLLKKLKATSVMGNHDQALFDEELASCFSPHAHEALIWTRGELDGQWKDFLLSLPLVHVRPGFTLAHGSLQDPEGYSYLFTFSDAEDSMRVLQTSIGWIGHTHVPQLFLKKMKRSVYLSEGERRLDPNESYLINPGSVGQPRDRDVRASFAVFDDESYTLKLIRIPYDNRKAAKKIRAAGLPKFLADRLL